MVLNQQPQAGLDDGDGVTSRASKNHHIGDKLQHAMDIHISQPDQKLQARRDDMALDHARVEINSTWAVAVYFMMQTGSARYQAPSVKGSRRLQLVRYSSRAVRTHLQDKMVSAMCPSVIHRYEDEQGAYAHLPVERRKLEIMWNKRCDRR